MYSSGYDDDVPIAIIKRYKKLLLKPLTHFTTSSFIKTIY